MSYTLFETNGLFSVVNRYISSVPSSEKQNTPDELVPIHLRLPPSIAIAVT
jgi:hypothetical protein